MNHRSQRVADQIRQILARLIREDVRDPRLGFVTLTGVTVSKDLRHARAFVSFLQNDDTEIPLNALRRAAPFLRSRLAREAGLRHAPELRFDIDESIDEGFKVDRILDEIGPIAPEAAPEDSEPDDPN